MEKEFQCECGATTFTGRQKCYHDIFVDGYGNFTEDVTVTDSGNPYGPFYCVVCGKEYEDIPPNK